jgi:hypothetical protein
LSNPRLTIGIPTLGRPHLLERALRCCLEQDEPVRVIIADQGEMALTAQVVGLFRGSLDLRHFHSGVTSLLENWRAAADRANTEFFAWLQDDDILMPAHAGRVVAAFDQFPDALAWQAQLKCSTHANLACWYLGNVPWVPMDLREGRVDQWEGQILLPTAYFTSWSISPAVAFRRGAAFDAALASLPERCDIFTERTILAALGRRGPFVADPMIAGYWMQHRDNESRKQWDDQPRQTAVLVDWLDGEMDQCEGWEWVLEAWCQAMPTNLVVGWVNQLGVTQSEGKVGRYTERVKEIMLASLRGRVKLAEMAVGA